MVDIHDVSRFDVKFCATPLCISHSCILIAMSRVPSNKAAPRHTFDYSNLPASCTLAHIRAASNSMCRCWSDKYLESFHIMQPCPLVDLDGYQPAATLMLCSHHHRQQPLIQLLLKGEVIDGPADKRHALTVRRRCSKQDRLQPQRMLCMTHSRVLSVAPLRSGTKAGLVWRQDNQHAPDASLTAR